MKIDEIFKKRFEDLEVALNALLTRSRRGTTQQIYPILDSRQWCMSVLNLLEQATGQDSVFYKTFLSTQPSPDASVMIEDTLANCIGIFRAAKNDYLKGYLVKVRSIIEAEILCDGLEQAKELLKKNYKDAACIIGRVVLETTIKELCNRKNLSIDTLHSMNSELAKAGVYSKARQSAITGWKDLGNAAAHGDWNTYTNEQVQIMISGIEEFIASYI